VATPAIQKLKKLIAHEESARAIGSIAEAEAFAERIHRLLISHKLSLQEVELAPAAADESTVNGTEFRGRKREVWLECLANEIATSYFCQVVAKLGPGFFSLVIVGTKADREVVVEMLGYFERLARELAESETRSYREHMRTVRSGALLGAAVNRYRRSFLAGFSAALCTRLRESKERCEQSMALVRCDGKVEEFMGKLGLGKPLKPRVPTLSEAGLIDGAASGSRVALTAHTLKADS
jgi:hypothetical protein